MSRFFLLIFGFEDGSFFLIDSKFSSIVFYDVNVLSDKVVIVVLLKIYLS